MTVIARALTALALAYATVATAGCANFIREYPSTIWDAVEGTDSVELDDLELDGAIASCRLRYFCERQQFDVTEVVETPYSAKDELYEVPIGIPGTALGLAWYVVAELLTLGAADNDVSTAVLDWGAAGLNPLLPVEDGMFAERHVIRIEDKRPQEGSVREPYEAALRAEGVSARVRFAEPGGPPGEPIEVSIDRGFQLRVNLLAASPAIPSPDAQKVLVDLEAAWSEDAPAEPVSFELFLDADLTRELYEGRELARAVLAGPARDAEDQLADLGFSREVAEIVDRRSR